MKIIPVLVTFISFGLCIREPSLAQDLKTLAKQEFEKENYQKAIELLEREAAGNSQDPELSYLLGFYTHYYYYDSIPSSTYGTEVSDRILFYLRKSLQLNPTLRDAYSFIGSEYGCRAISQLQAGNANGFIEQLRSGRTEGGYPDWLLEYARNILRSCAPNAILFTGGDSETFPVWYCRFVEQFRADVTPVPAALLNRSWFSILLKKGFKNVFAAVPISWTLEQLIDMHPYKWKPQIIEIPSPKSDRSAGSVTPSSIRWMLMPDLKMDGRELLSSQRALLVDIIRTNQWQRPIHISVGSQEWIRAGLHEYLQLVGLTHQLVPFAARVAGKTMNLESTSIVLADSANFRAISTLQTSNIPRISPLLNNYRFVFLMACDSLAKVGKFQEANSLLATMDMSIPKDVLPISDGVQQLVNEIVTRIRSQKN